MGKTDLDRARKITTSSNWTGSASNNKAKREGVSETKGFVVRRKVIKGAYFKTQWRTR